MKNVYTIIYTCTPKTYIFIWNEALAELSKHCGLEPLAEKWHVTQRIIEFLTFFYRDDDLSNSRSKPFLEFHPDCLDGKGVLLLESLIWWIIISIPINVVSIIFAIQAPPYAHKDLDLNDYSHYEDYESNQTISDTGIFVVFFRNWIHLDG